MYVDVVGFGVEDVKTVFGPPKNDPPKIQKGERPQWVLTLFLFYLGPCLDTETGTKIIGGSVTQSTHVHEVTWCQLTLNIKPMSCVVPREMKRKRQYGS